MSRVDPFAQLNEQMGAVFMEGQRLKRRISALEAAERLRATGRSPFMPIEFKSQFGEDALLWELFAGQLDGFFIEVGAFDGYNLSVSYAFECIGWRGLLVEAIPDRCTECAKRRPRSRVVHAALSSRGSTGTAQFTVTEDSHGGMYSYLDAGKAHPATQTTARRTLTVPLTTLDDLLATHQGEIDFASIDVEGAELSLLNGFDLQRHRPKVLLIEDGVQGGNPDLTRFMSAAPYTDIGWLQVNRIFIRSDFAQQMVQRLSQ